MWVVLRDPLYMGRGYRISQDLVLALNWITLRRGRHACVDLPTEKDFYAKKT